MRTTFNPLAAAALALFAASACAAPMASSPTAASTAVAPTVATPMIAASHPSQASAALQGRAEDLLKLINGEGDPAKIFSPGVLAQVPAERFTKIAASVNTKYGRALAIDRIEATGPHRGSVFITFEKTQLSFKLGVQAAAPNLINELLFT